MEVLTAAKLVELQNLLDDASNVVDSAELFKFPQEFPGAAAPIELTELAYDLRSMQAKVNRILSTLKELT